MPANGESFSPAARFLSARAACASAPSVSTYKNACTSLSTSEIRSRCAWVSATLEVSPLTSAAAISAAFLLIIIVTLLHREFLAL